MPTNTPNFKIPKPLGSENVSRAALNTIYDTIDTNVAAMPTFAMSRQAIINGNFDVWQRGTSFSTGTALASAYTADRFVITPGGSTTIPVVTFTRQALTSGDIPNSFYYIRATTDGTGTMSSNSFYTLRQPVEYGTRNLCGAGKKVTLSFWARSSISGKKLGINLKQNYGTGGSPTTEEEITGTFFSLTSSWAKYTFTFTTNTLVGKTFGTNNDDRIVLLFWYYYGSDFIARVGASSAESFGPAGTVDITQVQLCAGDVALPFQPRSFGEELALCRRYFRQVGYGATGKWGDATSIEVASALDSPMRITPTAVLNKTNPVANELGVSMRTGTGSTLTFNATNPSGYTVKINGFSGATPGGIASLLDNAINLDAEL